MSTSGPSGPLVTVSQQTAKISHNLLSAIVVIGLLRIKSYDYANLTN